MAKKCSSCGREVKSRYSEFKCPQCGEEKIVRCEDCRTLATKYTCGKCGFTGP